MSNQANSAALIKNNDQYRKALSKMKTSCLRLTSICCDNNIVEQTMAELDRDKEPMRVVATDHNENQDPLPYRTHLMKAPEMPQFRPVLITHRALFDSAAYRKISAPN